MTRVAPILAILSKLSSEGIFVALPAVLVNITVWVTSGRVNSFSSTADAAEKLGTPGVIEKLILSSLSLLICSPIADHIDKSPE